MNVMMVRAKIKEENVSDAQAATEKVIQALEQARPADVRYAASIISDSVTFVAFLEREPGQEHPLSTFPAYAELVENLKQWYAEPPTVEYMTVRWNRIASPPAWLLVTPTRAGACYATE